MLWCWVVLPLSMFEFLEDLLNLYRYSKNIILYLGISKQIQYPEYNPAQLEHQTIPSNDYPLKCH